MVRPTALIVAAFLSTLAASALRADVKLPTFFSDNMVLQQNQKITVWGKADAGEKVAVTLGDTKAAATANDKGEWQVAMDARKASAEPIDLTVEGKNKIVLKNILIGEVWICSGQSNMAWKLAAAKDGDQEAKAADLPQIRLLGVNNITATQPSDDLPNKWVVCTPEAAAKFSAVGFLFGRELNKELKVPVGLINSSWGGSAIQSWIPISAYVDDPDVKGSKPFIDAAIAKLPAAVAALPAAIEKWKATTQAITATRPELATRPNGLPQAPKIADPYTTYGGMYNAMIAPLGKLGVAGVIWYQGESNAQPGSNYDKFTGAMVRSWRKTFARDDLPFLWVQLPNFMARKNDPNAVSGWAELRESQTKALALPNTGMAVIIDAGEAANIHPKDKQTPSHRLALAALGIAYKKDVQYLAPMLDWIKADGAKMLVKFKNCPGGLVNDGDKVQGFALAGADGKYHWADAAIAATDASVAAAAAGAATVIVTSPDVPAPVAVRYGWGDNPWVSLYNKAKLPACPFRAGEDKFAPATAPASK